MRIRLTKARGPFQRESTTNLQTLEGEGARGRGDEARFLMARALMREGTMSSQDKAIEELRAITAEVRSVPMASKAFTLLGIIYFKQGQLNRSLDAFNRALELDPSNTEAFQNRRSVADRLENG